MEKKSPMDNYLNTLMWEFDVDPVYANRWQQWQHTYYISVLNEKK